MNRNICLILLPAHTLRNIWLAQSPANLFLWPKSGESQAGMLRWNNVWPILNRFKSLNSNFASCIKILVLRTIFTKTLFKTYVKLTHFPFSSLSA